MGIFILLGEGVLIAKQECGKSKSERAVEYERERECGACIVVIYQNTPQKKKCNKIKYYVEMSSYQLWDLLGPMLDWSCDS